MKQEKKLAQKLIIVIGGGNVFASWSEFFRDWVVHGFYIDFSRFFSKQHKSWKSNLQADLNTVDEYEVIRLHMPQTYNARYSAWKRAFEKAIPTMQDVVILVGHSLGGLFLIKYLSEEAFPKKICATFLVSAPYDKDGVRTMPYFTLPESLVLFEKQSPLIFMYHSKDDSVVFFSEFERLRAALPSAKARVFEDRGHFSQEHFPELVQDIQNLPC